MGRLPERSHPKPEPNRRAGFPSAPRGGGGETGGPGSPNSFQSGPESWPRRPYFAIFALSVLRARPSRRDGLADLPARLGEGALDEVALEARHPRLEVVGVDGVLGLGRAGQAGRGEAPGREEGRLEDPREVVDAEPVARGEDEGPVERRLQLADVAGPGVAGEEVEDLGVEPARVGAEVAGELDDEVLDEGREVLEAAAQRRELDRDDVEAVEEVLAELVPLDGVLEVEVGGRDDLRVGLDGLRPADALELLVLDDAQELGLDAERGLADLVEEDRPPLRELEPARLPPVGAGEGALLVPEELRLGERLGERRAVELDERPVRPRGEGVEDPRDEVLPRPRLAADEDRDRPRRRAREGRLDPLRRLGPADEGVEVPAAPQVRLQALVLDGEPQARLEELLDEAGVLDGDGREVGEGLEEGDVAFGEEARGVAVVDVDRAGGPLLDEERDAEEGDDGVGVDRLAPLVPGVDPRVGRADGAAVGDDPLDDGARDRLGLVLRARSSGSARRARRGGPVTGSARRIIPRSALSRLSARSTMSSRTAERSRVELTMRETS